MGRRVALVTVTILEGITMQTVETLATPWIILDGDYVDYACEQHARQYAKDNGIAPSGADSYATTVDGYGVKSDVYALPSWYSGETDYPASCPCGQYLDVSLTRDGHAYMIEHGGFPAWLYTAHGVTA